MKASRKKYVLLSLVAILAMAATLSACGNGQVNRENGTSKTTSSIHGQTTEEGRTDEAAILVYNRRANEKDGTNEAAFSVYSLTSGKSRTSKTTTSTHQYTYVALSGNKYSGTYTGDWSNNQPNGEGSFTGKGEKGTVSIDGSWINGQPNKYCRQVIKRGNYVYTYSGDFFYGEMNGSGTYKTEDLKGNLVFTYEGEFRDSRYNGSGELTYYYTGEKAAELGYYCLVYTGEFANSVLDGEGAKIFYYTEEYGKKYNHECEIIISTFSGGNIVNLADTTQILFYTQEFAENSYYDYVEYTGQLRNGKFVEPYRYIRCKDGKIVEQGRVKNGKCITDEEKIIGDAIYDEFREAAGDGIWGDLMDIFGPSIYDRYGE